MLRASLIILFVIIFFAKNACAQSYKDSIQSQFLRYTQCLAKKDYTCAAEYINPDFFKIIPKDRLIQILEQSMNNPDVEHSMSEPKVNSIGDSKFINAQNYAKFKYSNYITMRYKVEDENRDMKLTMELFQESFGKENVTFNEASNSFTIFVVKEVITNSKDQSNWSFVVLEEKQKPILEKFIPKELF